MHSFLCFIFDDSWTKEDFTFSFLLYELILHIYIVFWFLSDHTVIFCYFTAPPINTQYMTNLTIVYPVKMEYGWNFSISGLKMMVKREFTSKKGGVMIKSINLVITMTWCAHGGISKKNLVSYLHMIDETLSHKFHPYSILTG